MHSLTYYAETNDLATNKQKIAKTVLFETVPWNSSLKLFETMLFEAALFYVKLQNQFCVGLILRAKWKSCDVIISGLIARIDQC